MYRDNQDALDAYADPYRWKNGRRFQSHGEASGAAIPSSPHPTGRSGEFASPAKAAAALVTMYGPTRALSTAEAQKREHPEYSPMACFWDETARLLEQGIVAARTRIHEAGAAITYAQAAMRGAV